MAKCPEHAVTIWQDIVNMAIVANLEASTLVSIDVSVDIETRDV